MVNKLELNIVILPDEKVKELAIDVSRKLRETYQTDFVLDGKSRHPHITVYHLSCPEKNLDSVRAYLKTVAGRNAPFEINLGKFSGMLGFVSWIANLSNEILHLQKSVLYQLNPLRQGLVPKIFEGRKRGMDETYNIQNYGSPYVGSLFQPRMTITHMQSEQDAKKAVQGLVPRIAKFVATKIHLGVLGDYGTVTEILEEFPFGGQSPYMLKPQNYF